MAAFQFITCRWEVKTSTSQGNAELLRVRGHLDLIPRLLRPCFFLQIDLNSCCCRTMERPVSASARSSGPVEDDGVNGSDRPHVAKSESAQGSSSKRLPVHTASAEEMDIADQFSALLTHHRLFSFLPHQKKVQSGEHRSAASTLIQKVWAGRRYPALTVSRVSVVRVRFVPSAKLATTGHRNASLRISIPNCSRCAHPHQTVLRLANSTRSSLAV